MKKKCISKILSLLFMILIIGFGIYLLTYADSGKSSDLKNPGLSAQRAVKTNAPVITTTPIFSPSFAISVCNKFLTYKPNSSTSKSINIGFTDLITEASKFNAFVLKQIDKTSALVTIKLTDSPKSNPITLASDGNKIGLITIDKSTPVSIQETTVIKLYNWKELPTTAAIQSASMQTSQQKNILYSCDKNDFVFSEAVSQNWLFYF